jgi:tRNA A37 threonylcarbamoyladenosine modification protein TsaB
MNHAVIDLSENFLRLGLKDSSGTWREESEPMRGRESSRLAAKVIARLEEWGCCIEDIQAWTVGSGPGNFTGLRMAAAFVAGIAAVRRDIIVRNVPSACMFSGLLPDGTPVPAAVVYDGKNSELVIYRTDTGKGYVCPREEAAGLVAGWEGISFCTPGADADIVRSVLTDIAANISVPVPELRVLADSTLPFTGRVSDLEYIRPAVRPH